MRIFTFLLFLLPILGNAQIWTEDFDGSNTTNPVSNLDQCFDTGSMTDYFDIVCPDGVGCTNEIPSAYIFNNVSGQHFGVRDMDADPCSSSQNKTFSFAGIDVSSCAISEVLYICFDVAESRNMGDAAGAEWGTSNAREDTWDSNSYLHLDASIDGNPFSRVTAIANQTIVRDGSNTRSDVRPGIDVNCNGESGDAGEPELTDTFTKYCFELPTSGSSLALNFIVNGLNTQGEDLAVDNVEVFCSATPAAGTLLDACTPWVPGVPSNCNVSTLWLENFDGSNTTNPPTLPACDATPSRDYLGIVCNNGAGCPNEINSDYLYFGASGQYFGVRDMDNVCGGSIDETLSFSGIDISGCSGPTNNLYLCFDMAESQPNNGREMTGSPPIEDSWDGNSNINLMVSIDGCDFEEVTALESTNGTNSRPGIDTNCGGGSAGTSHLLSDNFQTFCFLLTQNGSSLDLNIQVIGLNTDGEDVAIDNIALICADNPTCLSTTPIVSCTIAEPLAITCPADNLNLPAGCFPTLPAPDPSLVQPEGCGITATVTHEGDAITNDDGCMRTVTRTYSAIGENGDMAECEQLFTFSIDTDPPMLSAMPADMVVACDGVPPVPTITVTDDCAATGSLMVIFDEVDNSTPCEGGTITRTWTSETDDCGNAATPHVQVITVTPSPAPTITCPPDQVVSCFEDIVTDPTMATTTPGCGAIVAVYVKQPSISGGIPGCDGTVYTYIYKAVDECGNTAECEQQFLIQNNAPTISVIPGTTIECFDDIEVLESDATVTTDCSGDYTLTIIPPVLDGSLCTGDEVVYTYRVKDFCNRIVETTRTFTVQNLVGPIITSIPLNYTTSCSEGFGPNLSEFIAEGNCGSEIEYAVSDAQITGTLGCGGSTVQYRYSAMDGCGRIAEHVQTITFVNEGPVLSCPETLNIVNCQDGATEDLIEAWLASVTATSTCGGAVQVNNSFNGNAGMCLGNNFTNVTFFATDECGVTRTCVGTIVITDTEAPIIYEDPEEVLVPCNGVTQLIFENWLATQGGAQAIDGCWGNDISWSMNPSNPQLNCAGGPQAILVEFIARDGCGNSSSVTGIFNTKTQPDMVNVAGSVEREDGDAISNVEVQISGDLPGVPNMTQTNEEGSYGLPEIEFEENMVVAPQRNDDPLNGVSTNDLITLQHHILGNVLLDSPYKKIAADVNNSGSISTLDLVYLRRLILFIDEEFTNNSSWRFVAADFVFPNVENPFETAFPEVYSLEGLEEEQVDFIGVKIGDLNLSAITNGLMEVEDRSTLEDLNFEAKDVVLNKGQQYEVEFSAQNFERINGFQFTLNFDETALENIEIKSADLIDFDASNYGLSKVDKGAITMSWNSNGLVDLNPEATAFTLVFNTKKSGSLSDFISITSQYTQAEAYREDNELMNVDLVFEESQNVEAFKLFQNQPNPFKDETKIVFLLPESQEATLVIYDLKGSVLKKIEGSFEKGYNEVLINQNDLLGTGVVIYQLTTATESASKKMTLID